MTAPRSRKRFAIGPRRGFSEKHRVTLVWGALFLNGMPFFEATVLPIPSSIGVLVSQGSLAVALVLAIRLNPRMTVRLNLLLLLISAVAVVAIMTGMHNDFWQGSTYRGVRYLVFVLVLWLLTPLWGRDDRILLSAHVAILKVVTGSAVAGFLLFPGVAGGERLSGVLWPIYPTQLAHYAAVLLGLLLIQRLVVGTPTGRAFLWVPVSLAVLIGTHTRTAVVALLVGLVAAIATLFLGYARVRRLSVVAFTAAVISVIVFGPVIGAWLYRGESDSNIATLTGRTLVWEQVLAVRRNPVEAVFGSGMSDASFSGLSIDSSWVATIYDSGWFGLTVLVVALSSLLLASVVRPRGLSRAIAVFLIVYLIVASFAETALNAPTPYLLDLTVAAALLARPVSRISSSFASRPKPAPSLVRYEPVD